VHSLKIDNNVSTRVMELANADGQDDCARCSRTRWVTRWVLV